MAEPKLLVVVQRYGEEVVGGAEYHARLLAERLALSRPVEVATTTALDWWTWAPHYAEGTALVGGIPVHRFAVRSGRSADFKELERKVFLDRHTLADEYAWIRKQGPHCPALLEYLHRHGADFAAILFYTYLYEPTVLGLPLVPERAILVSTAHQEYALRLAPYRALFHLPRAIGYLTEEERALIQRTFRNEHVPSEVLGVALAPPPAADAERFRRRHGIAGPYVLYLGQVSEGKGVDELAAWWREAGERTTLVLAGEPHLTLPKAFTGRAVGRVSEQDKWDALAGADALVLPSRFESLGIVLLEAWQAGTPVLVHAANAVTAGQVRRSGGGWCYGSADELFGAISRLGAEGRAAGERGRAWVARECAPEAFDARLERLVAEVSQ